MTDSTDDRDHGAPPSDSTGMQEIVEAFKEEASDQLSLLESALMDVESLATDKVLHEAFRAAHSIKGNAGCLGLVDIELVAHKAEDVLDGLRKRAFASDSDLVSAVLGAVDAIRNALSDVDRGGVMPNRAEVVARLDDTLERARGMKSVPRLGEILVAREAVSAEIVADAIDFQRRPIGELLVDLGVVDASDVEAALVEQTRVRDEIERAHAPLAAAPPPRDEAPQTDKLESAFVRVDTEKLDGLLDQVGELIAAVSAVIQSPDLAGLELDQFSVAAGQLSRVTASLHDAAMAMRMVPLSRVVSRLNRLVRDLRVKLGKPVRLVVDGENTEVDKSVLDGIVDPLVHIIRNSIDHGIEPHEARAAAGKPREACIRLEARHHGGEVCVSVSDDGRGLDADRIRAKAESLGWIAPGQPVSEAALHQLVFRPGFSTAQSVSGVSGRGVGMDVVKTNIDALRGRVELVSEHGRGTTVHISLPLTLAIIDVMLVGVDGVVYGLPLLSLRESVAVRPEQVTQLPDGTHVVRIRDRVLPVLGLERTFDVGVTRHPAEGILAVVEHADGAFCLRVDQLLGQRQVVIKPLDPYVANVRGISGCAVLGSGEICLIADIGALVELTASRSGAAE